jgi:DNA-binding protein HU-beta
MSNVIKKAELVSSIAEEAGLSKASAARALDATTDAITSALKNGDKVTLVGFGTFSVKERAARTGRNPQTGATMQIKASKAPHFKVGKSLKEAVN